MEASDLKINVLIKNLFSYFSTKTYVVGTQKKRFNVTRNIMFKLMGKKIFTILGSTFLFISTNDLNNFYLSSEYFAGGLLVPQKLLSKFNLVNPPYNFWH